MVVELVVVFVAVVVVVVVALVVVVVVVAADIHRCTQQLSSDQKYFLRATCTK